MRAKILLLLLSSMHYCFAQQSWHPMGSDDFNKASYGRSGVTGRQPLIVQNDHVFFFHFEYPDYNSGSRLSIGKYANNKWEQINYPFLFTAATTLDCTVSNNETIYFACNDIWGDGFPVVKKYENGSWTNVGSGISTTTSSLINITLGTDNQLRIFYRDGNLIKLKKFDGTDWVLISETSELLPYSSISFYLDNNNVPYVITNYPTAGSYNCFVKKFNGTNWEEVGITGYSGKGTKLSFDTNNIPHLAVGSEVKKYVGSAWENVSITRPPRTYINSIENICFDSANNLYIGYLGAVTSTQEFFIQRLTNGTWQLLSTNIFMDDRTFTAFENNLYRVYYAATYFPQIIKQNEIQSITLNNTPTPLSSKALTSEDSSGQNNEIFTHDFSVCNGIPMIARVNNDKASVSMYINDSWTNLGVLQVSENEIGKVAIESGTDGKIYIAYNNRLSTIYDTKLTVKKLTDSGWQAVGPVNFSLTAGSYFDFKVSHANEPYVLYRSGRVQKFNGTDWVFVGNSAYTGDLSARLALDVNDVPYIAYQDNANNNQIAVKRLNGNVWEYVDQSGLAEYTGPHLRPRIIIDRTNTVYIGFTDLSKRVYIKRLVNGAWQSVGSDFFSTLITDQFEMALDHNDVLHVAYNEMENDFKYYAKVKKFNGSEWELVGSSAISATSALQSKIDFSVNNTPIITYSTALRFSVELYTKFFGEENALGIDDNPITDNTKWNVSPNPVKNIFSINGISGVKQVEVFDLLGKKVLSEKNRVKDIDVSFLRTGLYIVKVTTASGTGSVKLIKD